jgi:hypothetical protein
MNAPVKDHGPSRRTVVFAGASAAGGLAIGVPMAAEASIPGFQRTTLADGQNLH